jgi:hypothetical protein
VLLAQVAKQAFAPQMYGVQGRVVAAGQIPFAQIAALVCVVPVQLSGLHWVAG